MLQSAFVVTGAASGLGRAVLDRLARQGCAVAGLDLNNCDVPEGCASYACDVTDAGAVQDLIDQVVCRFGGIAGAVTCAGIAPSAKLVGRKGRHDPALFAKVLAVNTVGTFNVLTSCAEAMQANSPDENGGRGVIITIASIAAFEGQIGQIAYAASKGAVASMTLPAARELARFGIRVVSLAPGVFDTPMMQAMPDEVRSSIAATIPFPPQLGDPEDFASLVSHIIDNKTLNGEIIRLDGALRMAGQ